MLQNSFCPGNFKAVALLSLFDGLGTARLALQDALEELGQPAELNFAGYRELDSVLASAVEEYWAAGVRAGGWLPYHRLAADVWDLLRHDGGRFQRLCELLPRDALALIVGGSPCQDVSPMGPGRGRAGLCGERSIDFFIFPVLARALSRARPDLVVHVVVEHDKKNI
jgi:site-specific DNA-cytosine methylase